MDGHDIYRAFRCSDCCTPKFDSRISGDTNIELEYDDEEENDAENNNNNKLEMIEENSNKDDVEERSLFYIYWSRYRIFVKTPKVHYIYEIIFYLVFLVLFSYTILCKFNYYTANGEQHLDDMHNLSNSSDNSTLTNADNNMRIADPSAFEYTLIVWILLFIIDEIYQVTCYFNHLFNHSLLN